MFGSISTRMAINASALIGERYAACARCANRSPHSQLTSSLQEACSQAWDTLPAQMPYESATAALKAVGFVGALFHDPFHAAAPQQHRVGWSWAPGAMPFAAAVWSIEGAILVSVLIDPDVLVDDFARRICREGCDQRLAVQAGYQTAPGPAHAARLRCQQATGPSMCLHWPMFHLLHVGPGQS